VIAVPGTLEDGDSLSRLIAGADAVVHCAGVVAKASRAQFRAVNGAGTARLAALAAAAEVPPRFILMSSLAAREPGLSAYGASKRDGEIAVAHLGDSLPWTVLRPAAVYGPGDRATLAIFRQMAAGFMAVPAGAAHRVSLIYAADLAAAVTATLAPPPGHGNGIGATFEIGDRRPGGYGWRQIAEAGGRALDRRIVRLAVPRMALMAVAAASLAVHRLAGKTPLVTPGKVRELYHPDWVCDDGAMADATGWAPRTTIDQGFVQTVDWYRNHGWL
jgi:nucleoside-diphosphate-sugar epimerase